MTDNPEPGLEKILLDNQTELQMSINRVAETVSAILQQLARLNGNVQRNDERSREAMALASANKDRLALHETKFATLDQETKAHTANWKTVVDVVFKVGCAILIGWLLFRLGL